MQDQGIELSFVIPCLNEADSLGYCVNKAKEVLKNNNISGEIIVADNGSRDGSQEIAVNNGCRLIKIIEKGYGNALIGGICAAKGRYIIMGDADDSYDFLETPKFLDKLRNGAELVQGCRFSSGGGRIEPGAMPLSHRYFGNPFFSLLARVWFKVPLHDIYCGMRGFSKDLYNRLGLRCTGMEFATEMTIKATLFKAKIDEVPITLHPDKRKAHKPHLKTFADGWRTLRFFMILCPRWLFIIPGMILLIMGILGYALGLPSAKIGNVTFEGHTLLFSSLFILCGCQTLFFAIFTKTFAINEGILPKDELMVKFYHVFNLERGLIIGACNILLGIGLLLWTINLWRLTGFQQLDYSHTLKLVIPGVTLTALGFQIILSGFFVSILGMQKNRL